MDRYQDNLAYADAVDDVMHVKVVECAPLDMEVEAAKKPVYAFVKRACDIVISLMALVLLSPVFLVVALLIKREDGGPVFYESKRVGLGGQPIGVFKFRSMKPNADRLEDMLTPEELAEYREEFKLTNDPRITRIGSVLRKSSLDELPQLLNILRGDMSMVGPRPLVKDEVEEKYTFAQRKQLLSVRPGLTGLWQVSGRSDCTYESGERQKIELLYVEQRSLLLDIKILFQTVGVVLEKVGAR